MGFINVFAEEIASFELIMGFINLRLGKVLNGGCDCVVITVITSVVNATMWIAIAAAMIFFLNCTKYSICIYNCYNSQIHIIYHI